VGDGARGFWSALEEVYPETRHQRGWVHKTANGLNALPKSLQANAKAQLHDIWLTPTRAEAIATFDRFVQTDRAKYPKAADKLVSDRDALLACYDFPTEHWMHLRTTNPVESTCATVRHRTTRTKHCVSRSTVLGLAFKLVQEAEKSWRRIRGYERIAELMAGGIFKDGEPVREKENEPQQRAA
jgi:transposase-like protein